MSFLKVNRPIHRHSYGVKDAIDDANYKIAKIMRENMKMKKDISELHKLYRQQKQQWVILHKAQCDYLLNREKK